MNKILRIFIRYGNNRKDCMRQVPVITGLTFHFGGGTWTLVLSEQDYSVVQIIN